MELLLVLILPFVIAGICTLCLDILWPKKPEQNEDFDTKAKQSSNFKRKERVDGKLARIEQEESDRAEELNRSGRHFSQKDASTEDFTTASN